MHIWGGIGWNGPTAVCVFEGRKDAALYVKILQSTLLPTITSERYATGHRFMQDNHPNHTSRTVLEFFHQHEINWWQTPPQSIDVNPIENLWHELKVCQMYL